MLNVPFRKILSRLAQWFRTDPAVLGSMADEITDVKMLSAKSLIAQISQRGLLHNLREAEFKVFSQFGEDGIIQYLVRQSRLPADRRTFVEIGVESYIEANTRFLLMNDNWRGLIVDGSDRNIADVKKRPLYWRHDLTAIAAFVDADNINGLIADAGFSGDIGLLSIDVDGNDYWIWDRIDVVSPIIVVAEYNSVFGGHRAVTVPYDASFVRSKAHYSHLYWGCSLKALEQLGRRKGYALVGTNTAGNNAFFVRRDHLNGQPELTAEDAYVESRFRESRDRLGNLSYLSGKARLQELADCDVVDVETGERVAARDLFS